MISRINLVLVLSIAAAVFGGCVSSPGFRSPTPLPENKVAEVGAGVSVHAGPEHSGGIAMGWGRFVVQEKIDIMVGGHGGASGGYELLGDNPLQSFGFGGYTAGASVGARFRYAVFDHLQLGLGGHVEYLDHSYIGKAQRFGSLMVSLPVAERVIEDVWVYIRPTVGLTLSLNFEPNELPFFGNIESPVGVQWIVNEHMSVMAEGAYYMPSRGAYGGVATTFTF